MRTFFFTQSQTSQLLPKTFFGPPACLSRMRVLQARLGGRQPRLDSYKGFDDTGDVRPAHVVVRYSHGQTQGVGNLITREAWNR